MQLGEQIAFLSIEKKCGIRLLNAKIRIVTTSLNRKYKIGLKHSNFIVTRERNIYFKSGEEGHVIFNTCIEGECNLFLKFKYQNKFLLYNRII